MIGTDNGTLTITDDASNNPQSVPLSGTGIAPTTVTPTSLSFASQQVGTTSGAKSVTLKNNQNVPLTSITVSISGDYAQTNNCPATLNPGASCKVNVTFTPIAGGTRSGLLTLAHSAVDSPDTVSLTGTGTGVTVSVAPASLAFGNQLQNTIGAAQNVVITNTGSVAVTMAGVSIAGEFTQTNNCSASLAVGAACTVAVRFAPGSAGVKSGTLTVSDNATGSPQMVALSGTGTSMTLAVSPSSLSFAGQLLGTTSAAQTVAVTNTGTLGVAISSVVVSGDFAQTNNCPATLNPGAGCSIAVTFSPQGTGARSGTLTVNDNATGGPHNVALSGTGNTLTAAVSPSSLAFGDQLQSTTSSAQSITLSNTGTLAASVSSVTISGEFAQTNTCPATLAVGSSCTIAVTFVPQSAGSKTGTVTISDNANGAPQTVALSGNGTSRTVSLSAASLSFGDQLQSTSSAAQSVTVTATGTLGVAISGISISGEFTQTNTCLATLAPGTSCTIAVTFAPQTAGAKTGSVSIADNAAGAPQTIALSGNGTSRTVSLSPASLTFADQLQATTSAAQSIALTNTGTLGVSIAGISSSGEFTQTNTCPATLAAGTSCTIAVVFAPQTAGVKTGAVTISDDASNSPQTVTLSGNGTSLVLGVSPVSLDFGSVLINSPAVTKSVTLTNTGTLAITFTSYNVSGNYSQTNNCTASLAAGASCTVSVVFLDSTAGLNSGTLSIVDNTSGSPHTIPLTGTVTAPALTVSPTFLDFGDGIVGTTSAAQTLTLTSSGTADFPIAGITAPADFVQTNNCPGMLAVGSSCTVSVSFSPQSAYGKSESLIVNASAPATSVYVPLTGRGMVLAVSLSTTTLSFVDQATASSGPAKSVYVRNTGTMDVTMSGITVAGAFTETDNCPSTLSVGTYCAIAVRFAPQSLGPQSGTLTINDSANGPQTVSLAGSGVTLAMTSLTMQPVSARVQLGGTTQLSAIANYNDSTSHDVTSLSTWATSDPTIITVTGGAVSGIGTGMAVVTAQYGSASVSANVTTRQGNTVPAGTMQFPRFLHRSVLLRDGRVLVIGGQTDSTYLGQSEIWDPATLTFHPAASLLTPRSGMAAVLMPDGRVLVAGGQNANGPVTTMEIYDPASDTFSPAGNGLTATRTNGLRLNDGRIFLMPGDAASSVQIYDPVVGASTNSYLFGTINFGTATLLQDGRVLALGADANWNTSTPELFDPATTYFALAGSFPAMVYEHTAALMRDGRVLIATGAGKDSTGNSLTPVEAYLFDPATGTFSITGSNFGPRYASSSALLADGRVAILGGFAWSFDSANVEIYDPAAGTFTVSEEMLSPRALLNPIVLDTGEVLMIGGRAKTALSGGIAVGTAELYGRTSKLTSIQITPANPTFTLPARCCANPTFQVLGVFDDGTSQPLTVWADWNSSDQSIINLSGGSGMASISQPGTVTITVHFAGMAATTTATVVSP